MTRPAIYGEFWGDYLRAHSHPRTRLIHYVGSILSLAALALAVIQLQPLWLLAMPVVGYGFTWYAAQPIVRSSAGRGAARAPAFL